MLYSCCLAMKVVGASSDPCAACITTPLVGMTVSLVRAAASGAALEGGLEVIGNWGPAKRNATDVISAATLELTVEALALGV